VSLDFKIFKSWLLSTQVIYKFRFNVNLQQSSFPVPKLITIRAIEFSSENSE
jgi:hypothetical protein